MGESVWFGHLLLSHQKFKLLWGADSVTAGYEQSQVAISLMKLFQSQTNKLPPLLLPASPCLMDHMKTVKEETLCLGKQKRTDTRAL